MREWERERESERERGSLDYFSIHPLLVIVIVIVIVRE